MPDQIIHLFPQKHPREDDVNAAAAQEFEGLTDEERATRFVVAMGKLIGNKRVPDAIGVGPGTVENIRRERRKSVPPRLYAKIKGAIIRVAHEQIRSLEATIHVALQGGSSARDDDLLAAATALADLKALIEGAAK